MRDSLAGAGPGNLKISCQRANHEENMVVARAQNPGIVQPATAVPVLKLYYQRTKIQPAAVPVLKLYYQRAGRKRERKSSRPLKLYHQRTEVQPDAGDGRSRNKAVLPYSENPARRRRRPFQYYSCTTRERKSRRPPETAVPVLKLYYQRTKIQPATGHGRSSTRRRRPFQY